MSPINNVVIAGGSGNVGSIFVDEFIKSQKFNVFVLTRKESSSTFPSGVHVLKTDYSVSSLTSLFSSSHIDAVISNLNGPAIGAPQIALVSAAKAAGVKRFFPSEFGVDTRNETVLKWIGLFREKKKTVDYLKTKEGDGFEWTAIINGPFFRSGIQQGFLQINLKEHKFSQWDDGAVPFSTTNIETVGKALINLLSSSERLSATSNKYVFISSYTITQKALFDVVRKATPGEEWTTEQVDAKAIAAKAKDEVEKGNLSAGYQFIKYITFAEGIGNLGDYRKVSSNDMLGLEKEDLETDVKNVVARVQSSH